MRDVKGCLKHNAKNQRICMKKTSIILFSTLETPVSSTDGFWQCVMQENHHTFYTSARRVNVEPIPTDTL